MEYALNVCLAGIDLYWSDKQKGRIFCFLKDYLTSFYISGKLYTVKNMWGVINLNLPDNLEKIKDSIKLKNVIIWFSVVIISVLAIVIGNIVVTKDFTVFSNPMGDVIKGQVINILKCDEQQIQISETDYEVSKTVYFSCKIKVNNNYEITTAKQEIDGMYASSRFMKEVESGDKVLLLSLESDNPDDPSWELMEYYRLDKILILAGVFVLAVILFGRIKGVNTILSLGLTFCFVFFVFVPSVMNGYNIYVSVVITAVYTIVMTLLLTNGLQMKTYATIIGCASGTVIAALITAFMSNYMQLTGYVDEHSFYLATLEKPINLTAVVFAAIIIGAIGAIMDVAMDIASSLSEMHEHIPDMKFSAMFKSGIQIGRDIMGTMANTLVLAYIGSSLTSIILLLTYSSSMLHLMNREVIIVDILQSLVGSLAILLTIPVTVLVCCIMYKAKSEKE